ncbi:winged helix-turn-helix domain-containing protein [Streptomyces sp. NPDC006733]|uniref:ArsR/SmtB family transcription factor n=1 Tax=Streptomyces sp. NPDC006733 TaxID=3155460 RepID=UPI0033F891D2
MKRIHFTAEDLARTRVGATIGVAAETLDSIKLLRDRDAGLAFRRWQTSVRGRLGEQVGPLAALLPAHGPPVDMASLTGHTPCIDEAVEHFLGASRTLLRLELQDIEFRPAHRSWARNLADGDREARLQVAAALKACHSTALAPYWSGVRSHLSQVRAGYAGAMADGGVEQLLTELGGPLVRWQPPVLHVAHPRDGDVHLDGRGLVIVPTMFSTRYVEVLHAPLDPGRAPILAVPSVHGAELGSALWESVDEPATPPLDDLLGRTRAAVLGAAVGGCGTTELARRLNISPAAASYHATVLRNAHLISTVREGKAVLHTVTSLGLAVLEQQRPLA